jgi:hypothetical protein
LNICSLTFFVFILIRKSVSFIWFWRMIEKSFCNERGNCGFFKEKLWKLWGLGFDWYHIVLAFILKRELIFQKDPRKSLSIKIWIISPLKMRSETSVWETNYHNQKASNFPGKNITWNHNEESSKKWNKERNMLLQGILNIHYQKKKKNFLLYFWWCRKWKKHKKIKTH